MEYANQIIFQKIILFLLTTVTDKRQNIPIEYRLSQFVEA